VSLEGANIESDEQALSSENDWQTLLPETKLKMDQQHYFDEVLQVIGEVSHVRVSIYPDGGVSRVRLFGQVHG
jgi:allantoicase